MPDYEGCYATLGVSPDTEWEALRAQYRRLISQWHPDRFESSSAERKLAEERSKRITAAYQALDGYRRRHGVLPRVAPTGRPEVFPGARGTDRIPDRAVFGDQVTTGPSDARDAGRGRRSRLRRVVIVVLLLVTALYLAYDLSYEIKPSTASLGVGSRVRLEAHPPPANAAAGEQRILSPGSTLGEVIAIQGVPTLARGDVWHYGRSEIRFSEGKVVSWREDPAFPLRIARNQPVQLRDGAFKIGSTKDDVRAVQGAPVVETATVWDYGLSRVFFEDDRVVRWEESPVQPLRVR